MPQSQMQASMYAQQLMFLETLTNEFYCAKQDWNMLAKRDSVFTIGTAIRGGYHSTICCRIGVISLGLKKQIKCIKTQAQHYRMEVTLLNANCTIPRSKNDLT